MAPVRTDIQGLRAIAVLAVLTFHIWPNLLPGGYVGVDVFFVISGYLITNVLLADIETHGRVSVGRFYARRIKRLLPAASCVLVAAAFATAWLPAAGRRETAIEIAASALYVQNHWLAYRARDYLAADDAPSLLQHYWSLSVEEQYYIAWPLLLGACAFAASRWRTRPRVVIGGMIALLLGGSLAWSIVLTSRDASQAYFATSTRAWELALGGALAIARAPIAFAAVRVAAGWGGIAAIVGACVWFSVRTPFPGYTALLPTLGCAAVLAAGTSGTRWPGDHVLSHPVLQYLGGISYSLYLWHWPVLVLLESSMQRALSPLEGMLAAGGSIAAAHATKRWVEDPCRDPNFASATPWQPFSLAAVCLASTLAGALTVRHLAARSDASTAQTTAVRGALALDDPGYVLRHESAQAFTPTLAHAKSDVASAYEEGCYQAVGGTEVKVCAYGYEDAALEIALVGDSHAVHWFPTFQDLLTKRRFRFYGLAKNACAFSLEAVHHGGIGRPYLECLAWSKAVVTWLGAHKPHVVLIAQSPRHSMGNDWAADRERVAEGMARAWHATTALGLRVIALHSTPWLPSKRQPRDCLGTAHDWMKECAFATGDVLKPDAVAAAAHKTGVAQIDLTDAFCVDGFCPPIIGDVLVYRDNHHITATYARTLAKRMERALGEHDIALPAR